MSFYTQPYEPQRDRPLGETCCKHGHESCDRCGTSDVSDRIHSTVGGAGKVGRLLKKKKSK